MTLSEELTWRGFVNQTTYADITELDKQKRTFYMGFDASADSQAVGNLAAMMFVKCFLRHGYNGVLLAGGATSLIGDPGGKDKERVLQDEATIAHNVQKAEAQLRQILRGQEFKMVNNLDWTRDMTVIPFLRDIGKYFSMTPLIQRDYIAARLGEGGVGISYTEFSYTVLQGMDYLHLFDTEGVTLQLGGADQWGNCLSGVELIRKARGAVVDVLTLNLVINKATGRKFGKSEEGAVWLEAAKTTPTAFYQFWMNVDDEGVEDYLKLFTELDRDEIERIMEAHHVNRAERIAQTHLAREVTRLVHGDEAAEFAAVVTDFLVGKTPVSEAGEAALEAIRQEIPARQVTVGASVAEAVANVGLASSLTEARRLLSDNAIAVNGQKITRDTFEADDFQNGRLLLRKGKRYKDSALIELTN